MIGLDTNVLVRYVMQDDEVQSPVATRLIESLTPERPGFVTIVATIETAWVLARAYRLTREQIARAIDALLRSREIVVDDAADVVQALRMFESGSADFADCLLERRASRAGCERTVTFDTRAAKTAGMTLLDT